MTHAHCGQPVAELYHGDDEIVFDIADVCGPATWAAIHGLAENFPCAPCAEEAGSVMRFAHDLINIKVGKQVMYPDDFRKWAGVVFETSAELGGLEAAEVESDKPVCEGAEAEALERCVLQLKEDEDVDDPFAVCVDTIGCKVG